MYINILRVGYIFSNHPELKNITENEDTCGQKLEDTLLRTVSQNYTDDDPLSIPARKWSFDQAVHITHEFMNGKFMDLITNHSYPNDMFLNQEYHYLGNMDYILQRLQSANVVSMDKIWLKQRLEWIETQKPKENINESDSSGNYVVVEEDKTTSSGGAQSRQYGAAAAAAINNDDHQAITFDASTLAVACMAMIGAVAVIVKRRGEYHHEGYTKIVTENA